MAFYEPLDLPKTRPDDLMPAASRSVSTSSPPSGPDYVPVQFMSMLEMGAHRLLGRVGIACCDRLCDLLVRLQREERLPGNR